MTCSELLSLFTFAQFAEYLHSRQNLNSQLQPSQIGSFITLTDSDYDPEVKMNVFLDLLLLFTGHLIQLCIMSKAIYAPQPNLLHCMIKAVQ